MIRKGMLKEGEEAHHVLPKQFKKYFKDAGLNINDPKYGYWLTPADHRGNGKAYRYNKAWEEFWETENGEKVEHTIKEILDMAQKLMDEIYEKTVSF